MLVTGKEILQDAYKNHYAVGAFNIMNLEGLRSVIDAAEQERSPILIQTTEGGLGYGGIEYLGEMVKIAAQNATVPVALHLDHGGSFEMVMQCLRRGWTSVMIDGSHLPLKENIDLTRRVVDAAHAMGVSVEAELGRLSGIEDNLSVSEKDAIYTNPDEAEEFVKATGVDYLAIAIGTAHGKYKGVPKLDFDRLDVIKKRLDMPIVLHGASGIPEDSIKKAISLGINKINIDTDIRIAYIDATRKFVTENPDIFDPRKVFKGARIAMTEVVAGKMRMFGCAGRA